MVFWKAYAVGAAVEYWSDTFHRWMAATVEQVNEEPSL